MKKRVLLTLAMLAAVAGCELGSAAMWVAKAGAGGFVGTLGGSLSTLLLAPNVNVPALTAVTGADAAGNLALRLQAVAAGVGQ